MFLLLTSVSQDIRKAEASSSSGCVHKPSSENIGVFFVDADGGVSNYEGLWRKNQGLRNGKR